MMLRQPVPVEQVTSQIAGAYATGYTQGGNGFAQGITPLATNFILATVQAENAPANRITHIPSGYKTFESFSYTGMNLNKQT